MTVTPTQGHLAKNPRQAAQRSTVVWKYVMASSGIVLILWLLAHMYGNLKVFEGEEGFDSYAEYLRTLGQPLLPRGGFLWISRVGLLVLIFAHTYAAVKLWRRDRSAAGHTGRGNRYVSTQNRRPAARSYSSYTLRWGGLLLAAFIVYHLLHLSANNTIHPGGESTSEYQRLVNGFEVWWVVLSYAVAMLALGFHVRHGIWSAATTLGANTSPTRRRNLNLAAVLVAAVITVGFLVPPFSVLFGLVD